MEFGPSPGPHHSAGPSVHAPEHSVFNNTPPPAPAPSFSPPQPPAAFSSISNELPNDPRDDQPTPVVQVLSVRGVEYVLMTFMLWFAAGSLLWIISSLIEGMNDFDMLAMPVATLLVSLPVFAFFFIRLKRAEVANPKLRFDPSKRRTSQLTQYVAFLVCIFTLIGFVYLVMQKIGGDTDENLLKAFGNVAVILLIAGGVFAYYWNDEHRISKR